MGLAFSMLVGAYLASPFATLAAAEADGLGPGGAAFAYSYVNVVAIVLAFIFGFALRDVVHRLWTRTQARKKSKPAAPRA